MFFLSDDYFAAARKTITRIRIYVLPLSDYGWERNVREKMQVRSVEGIKLLADNVKLYRTGRNLSQEALANIAEIECSQVSRIERGVLNTSVSAIYLLANALNIKPAQLLTPISTSINYCL